MKRRFFPAVVFAGILMLNLSINAYAAIQAGGMTPSLSYTGTTANCQITIYRLGEEIEATLELWHGNELAASWDGARKTHVTIAENFDVTSGETYTLKAHGTIGGVPFTTASVTKTCP